MRTHLLLPRTVGCCQLATARSGLYGGLRFRSVRFLINHTRCGCLSDFPLTRRSSVCCFTLSGGRATAVLRADTFSGGRAYILLSKGRACCPLATLKVTCCPNAYAFIATATAFVISTRVPSALDYQRVKRLAGFRALTITVPGLSDL